ncbi:Alpha/Beta hydrolase protein [Lactifluus subvellereus]|nr:Alpha/Beta hydrolase protein [Lactifluus subvellereus]
MRTTIVSMAIPFILAAQALSHTTTVNTTSGRLSGVQADGVASFKGIRFANSPAGDLRWEPPVAFVSSDAWNATSFGPSCVQQIQFQGQALTEQLYDTPAPTEDEDCLFLNVWAPAPLLGPLKPVIVWFYGGGYKFGTSSLPVYDGTSFAKNQDVIFVSLNYRTNVFGFPTAPDLPASGNNLGFLDQELALSWVQDNIAQFGGDKSKVTIMGHSAGSGSVSLAIARRNSSESPPFRAGIMLSLAQVSTLPELDFSNFNAFAAAVGCSQGPGSSRLQCLRNVPASTIRAYTNGPDSGPFTPRVDNVTMFDDPLQRIRTGQIARVPILLGSMEDDGTVFALAPQNLSATIALLGPSADALSPTIVRGLYPGLSDPQVIAAMWRDVPFRCPAKLWSDAFVSSGIKSVYRYTYGAVFADMQPFSNAGAWHGSELPILFGTFNRSTATAAEVELSHTLQMAFANFAKDPVNASPAPNWPAYKPDLPGVTVAPTLAKIAYHGNVCMNDFIEPVQPNSTDAPCAVWDQFLDFRP